MFYLKKDLNGNYVPTKDFTPFKVAFGVKSDEVLVCPMMGTQYYNYPIQNSVFVPIFRLEDDPQNEYDRHAIVVKDIDRNVTVGYIPSALTSLVRSMGLCKAKIISLKGEKPEIFLYK